MKSRIFLGTALALALAVPAGASAETYLIDSAKAHASIHFRIKHLGYSWLYGRFDDFSGTFRYDQSDPAASKVEVSIRTASVDSNEAERDKHLRSPEFLDVEKFPEARFVGTAFEQAEDGTAKLTGDFTLRGVTRPLTIDVKPVGHGPDPWGGYRRGFEGQTRFKLADFGIDYDLGPASREVELILAVEGIRQ